MLSRKESQSNRAIGFPKMLQSVKWPILWTPNRICPCDSIVIGLYPSLLKTCAATFEKFHKVGRWLCGNKIKDAQWQKYCHKVHYIDVIGISLLLALGLVLSWFPESYETLCAIWYHLYDLKTWKHPWGSFTFSNVGYSSMDVLHVFYMYVWREHNRQLPMLEK